MTDVIAENFQFGAKPQGARGNYSAPGQSAPKNSQSQEENIPTINLDDEQEEIRIEDVPF